MRSSLRFIASTLLLAATTACSSTYADVAGPSFAKGGGSGGTPSPTAVTVPNIAGHWTQSNRIHVLTALGSTDYWYEMDVKQNGGSLSGTAAQHANTFNFDGSPWLVNFIGSPGKVSGTMNADGTAIIVFNRIGETNITISNTVRLSADGATLVVTAPVAMGAVSFTR